MPLAFCRQPDIVAPGQFLERSIFCAAAGLHLLRVGEVSTGAAHVLPARAPAIKPHRVAFGVLYGRFFNCMQ